MKYKIEKNTVQETLILPLYSRKLCTELYPNLYRDETAVRLLDQIDDDFSEAEKNSRSLMQRYGAADAGLLAGDGCAAEPEREAAQLLPHRSVLPCLLYTSPSPRD